MAALSERMLAALNALPSDGTAISQTDLYQLLGYASGVGATLHALQRRGLVERVEGGWRKTTKACPQPS